ncbi:MAG: hypothetical protein GY854_03865 [Deltaproteobacteria bacterium]|nr:hypothetical protein [Deltaproteobacteria bacterium]
MKKLSLVIVGLTIMVSSNVALAAIVKARTLDAGGNVSPWYNDFSRWYDKECTYDSMKFIEEWSGGGSCKVFGRTDTAYANFANIYGLQTMYNRGESLGTLGVNWTASFWDIEEADKDGIWRDWVWGTPPKDNALDQAWRSYNKHFATEWNELYSSSYAEWMGESAPLTRYAWLDGDEIRIVELWTSIVDGTMCDNYPANPDNNFAVGSVIRNYELWNAQNRNFEMCTYADRGSQDLLLLHISTATCSHCVTETPVLDELAADYADDLLVSHILLYEDYMYDSMHWAVHRYAVNHDVTTMDVVIPAEVTDGDQYYYSQMWLDWEAGGGDSGVPKAVLVDLNTMEVLVSNCRDPYQQDARQMYEDCIAPYL